MFETEKDDKQPEKYHQDSQYLNNTKSIDNALLRDAKKDKDKVEL